MDFINQFKFNAPALADVLALLNVKTFTPEDVERFDALADDEKRAVLAISEVHVGPDDSISDVINAHKKGAITVYTRPNRLDDPEETLAYLRGDFIFERWLSSEQNDGGWAWSPRLGCWVEWRG